MLPRLLHSYQLAISTPFHPPSLHLEFGLIGEGAETPWEGLRLVLADERLSGGVVDVKDGGRLDEGRGTSLMERPSRTTFRRKRNFVFMGTFTYLDRPLPLRLRKCIITLKLLSGDTGQFEIGTVLGLKR